MIHSEHCSQRVYQNILPSQFLLLGSIDVLWGYRTTWKGMMLLRVELDSPKNPYVETLTPTTSECDCIWEKDL